MKLSDQQLLDIFRHLTLNEGWRDHVPVADQELLYHYALGIVRASGEGFTLLRNSSLILIAKYNLGRVLETEMVVHNFPGRTA